MQLLKLSLIQKLAIGYSIVFLLIFGLNAVPFIHDHDGNMFGLFKLDLIDDLLHVGSALWALVAGLTSRRQAEIYFKVFGPLYFLDGVFGLFTGSGYLDLGIFIYGPQNLSIMTKIFANLPHLFIGGFAALSGYVIAKKNITK